MKTILQNMQQKLSFHYLTVNVGICIYESYFRFDEDNKMNFKYNVFE